MINRKLKSKAVTYEILEFLGEGLNSTVYKAVRSDSFRHLRQTVALKILKSENAVDLWKKEFASLERVNGRHCVRVYGFDWIEGRPALVLEYVNGVSLRQLGLAGPPSRDIGLEILAQIQAGLMTLQEHGVCHGDLSPNNVMIDRDGNVKLLDFGWANGRIDSIQTTPEFAAPELLNGADPDSLTDLFSLGRIEEWLLEKKSSRLSFERTKRKPFEELSHPSRKKNLGRIVRRFLEHQNQVRNIATRSIQWGKNSSSIAPRVLAVLLLLLFAPKPQRSLAGDTFVKIRSSRWLGLSVDGVSVGYAPQDLLLESNKTHIVHWHRADTHGTLGLSLKKGQTRFINDKSL